MISVRPMTHLSFVEYKKYAIQEWAKYSVKGGCRDLESALEWSNNLINNLLPEDEKTKNQYIFSIFLDETEIGFFWTEDEGNGVGHARDLEIYKDYRGKGYAKEAIKILMSMKRNYPQIKKIKLEVHAHNDKALKLYNNLGFEVYQYIMVKELTK